VVAFFPAVLMPTWLRFRCEPWRSPTNVDVGWLTGACLVARRDFLLELGPFDERIHLYGEDLDLGIRARRTGARNVYSPDVARVVHLGDRSSQRRFADSGLELSIRNRRLVVQAGFGRGRERFDFGLQVVYHALRWVAKRMLRRDCTREQRWLTTASRLARQQ
jgi:GT2 family glycosyltransferase